MKNNQIIDNMIDERYSILSKIDSGSFGVVYLVKDNENQINYAAKIFKSDKGSENELEINNIVKEIKSKYILKLVNSGKGIIRRNGKIFKNKKYYIFEYASKGDFFKYIRFSGKLKEKHCKFFSKKILKTIKKIHDKGIYHLDIKLENILLDENLNPKIADYGLSKKYDENNKGIFYHSLGTEGYMPPQMYLKNIKFSGIKSDIFSLAVTMFILIAGIRGFCSSELSEKYYRLIFDNNEQKVKKYWEKLEPLNIFPSSSFKELYVKMVSFKEEDRPDIQDILKDK